MQSRTQFLRLCRDSHLAEGTSGLDTAYLNLLYERVYHASPDQAHGMRITFADFVTALVMLSPRLYPKLGAQEAAEKVIQDHVLA